jgi:hypothetical protein
MTSTYEISKTECNAIVEADGRIAFNGKYLMDMLPLYKDSKIAMFYKSPSNPGLFTANDKTCVMMPMFVQWDTPKETVDCEPDEINLDNLEELDEPTTEGLAELAGV